MAGNKRSDEMYPEDNMYGSDMYEECYPDLMPPKYVPGEPLREISLVPGNLYKIAHEVSDWMHSGSPVEATPTYMLLSVQSDVPSQYMPWEMHVANFVDLRSCSEVRSIVSYVPHQRETPKAAFARRGFYLISAVPSGDKTD